MPAKLFSNMQQQIEEGIAVLKEGGIVAYPTDTVYGLGACISIPGAVDRIYQVKKRPRSLSLPLLLADTDRITGVAREVPPIAWQLINSFWPGALTIVLPRSKSVPDSVTAGGDSVAIRVPAHPVPAALIRGLGTPITGTSANLSGRPNPLTPAEVYAQLGAEVDLIIGGGPTPSGKESTIVDVTQEPPLILREGAISREEIEKICPNVNFRKGD